MVESDKLGEALDKIQKAYTYIEGVLEQQSSQLHEPEWLKITKMSGENNYEYRIGDSQEGYCKGIEVGKCVYLVEKGTRGRWFRTSTVVKIYEQNNTFETCNSVYKYEWDSGK